MTWINLVAMIAFLFNGLMSVVTAALADLNIYPKVTADAGNDDFDGLWIEHSGALEEFKPSRPVKHWHHGYGFALAVDHDRDKPYLLCFKSGLTKWYVSTYDCLSRPADLPKLPRECTRAHTHASRVHTHTHAHTHTHTHASRVHTHSV
jgi:hypothetical protein